MEDISFWIAIGGGLASFFSPCVLPLVPVYLASLSGPEILDPETSMRRMPVFLHSLSFVLGFSIVFTAMGAIVGLAGVFINPNSPLVQMVSGSLLVALGLYMLAAVKIPWLNYEKRLSPSLGRTTGYLRSLLTGGVFTLALIPCVTPIAAGVLTIAYNLAAISETAWQGTYLLAVYSLGLGIPFLIIGAAFGTITPLIKRIHRYSRVVYIISGVLLIAIGILILTGKLTLLYL